MPSAALLGSGGGIKLSKSSIGAGAGALIAASAGGLYFARLLLHCFFDRLEGRVMIIHPLPMLGAAMLAASISVSFASPCSDELDRVQPRVDARLEAMAGAGPSAPESAAALRHRQPTPGSIAAAESKLDDPSSSTAAALRAAMLRAREADRAGDANACEQALAEVRRAIGE
jgi:hypothetical protein